MYFVPSVRPAELFRFACSALAARSAASLRFAHSVPVARPARLSQLVYFALAARFAVLIRLTHSAGLVRPAELLRFAYSASAVRPAGLVPSAHSALAARLGRQAYSAYFATIAYSASSASHLPPRLAFPSFAAQLLRLSPPAALCQRIHPLPFVSAAERRFLPAAAQITPLS